MKCFFCDYEVRWNNDNDTEDTYPESKHNIVSMYNCDNCDTWYEVFTDKKVLVDQKKKTPRVKLKVSCCCLRGGVFMAPLFYCAKFIC